jgi:hypothetical protein
MTARRGNTAESTINHINVSGRELTMKLLRKLPGFQRSPAGLEWRIWKRLHWVWLAGTALPLMASGLAYALGRLNPSAGGARAAEHFFYVMAGLVILHWTLVLTLAIGCAIVILMKGPAYVADAYPMEQPAERP